MGREKSKNRDAKRTSRFISRGKLGIPELEGYYFGHGDERAGSRFNRVVEKLADYVLPHSKWRRANVGRSAAAIRKRLSRPDEEV